MQEAPPNLVLIGFMATGKSTIGRRCAEQLGFRFRDSDTLIERRANQAISSIFSDYGEDAFRKMEREAIRDLCKGAHVVIATGGGAPMFPENVTNLRECGVVVLLMLTPEEILKRAGSRRTRPILNDAENPAEKIRQLMDIRAPVYKNAADAIVDSTGLDCEETARRVLEAYHICKERISWTQVDGKARRAES
jgi:shikimate kinase